MSLDLSNVFNEITINVKIINSSSHKLLCYDVYLNIIKKYINFIKTSFVHVTLLNKMKIILKFK